jgi:hypothetical protein
VALEGFAETAPRFTAAGAAGILAVASRTILPFYVRLLANQYHKNIICNVTDKNRLDLSAT